MTELKLHVTAILMYVYIVHEPQVFLYFLVSKILLYPIILALWNDISYNVDGSIVNIYDSISSRLSAFLSVYSKCYHRIYMYIVIYD